MENWTFVLDMFANTHLFTDDVSCTSIFHDFLIAIMNPNIEPRRKWKARLRWQTLFIFFGLIDYSRTGNLISFPYSCLFRCLLNCANHLIGQTIPCQYGFLYVRFSIRPNSVLCLKVDHDSTVINTARFRLTGSLLFVPFAGSNNLTRGKFVSFPEAREFFSSPFRDS